jgi:Zinc carboxypeptidase
MRSQAVRAAAVVLFTLASTAPALEAQKAVTSPKQQFGHDIGADYQLPNYKALTEYWAKLDRESDRMKVVEIGKTAEGRPQLMAIVSSPENHKKLDRYKEIARRLALAEGLTDDQARALAREGRAVVWIDGGLHATEVLGAQQLMETVYQLVSRSDPETMRLLDDVIVLAVHANPDGMDLVSDWYMREKEPTKRSTGGIPRLYQKYIGHDNNRDFYLSSQPETTNMNRILYQEWFPQIVYNHHQTGPQGTVLFAPPFRDPFNYVYDPLIPAQLDLVGAAMHSRFASEGKPGAATREGAGYSTWWNGGLRTTVYFHNQIGLLTETIGNPTPIEIPLLPERQLPSSDLFAPIAPQKWHFRQSVDYSVTANYAVLDIASRNRENFLYNIYRMGKNSIERGSRDYWTPYPRRIEALRAAAEKEADNSEQARRSAQGRGGASVPTKYFDMLRDPKLRDPRGYILPSDQPDFLTATKFVNSLIKTGVTVHRASASFSVAGKTYPAGSYVVKTAQAYRPHVLDMFEPQDHPNDFRYPGGPPIPPYDSAGWTLALQMGIKFDRILDGFEGPFEKIAGMAKAPAGTVDAAAAGSGWTLDHRVNDSVIAVNRLLKANAEVFWAPQGGFFVPAAGGAEGILRKAAEELGVGAKASQRPGGDLVKLRMPRIGLWDTYGGSMPSGWTRWLFEQYEFPFEVIFPAALDAGNLNGRYDVLIFVDGGIPERDGDGPRFGGADPDPQSVPAEWRDKLGRVTVAKTVPQLKLFLEEGGTILTVGGSAALAYHLGLPVANALTERTQDGVTRPLPGEKFYVPGSVLQVSVANDHPLAQGMGDTADVFFDNSPAFRLEPDAQIKGVRAVAWFDSPTPLRSGWAWGQHYLDGAAAVVDAAVGRGRLFLYGPEITFRAQPHGTFKFLFNGVYLGGVQGSRKQTTEQ